MADKGFDIQNDLKKLGLQLNIPPFSKDKVGFQEDDVIKTQTITRHRIHVERAIYKLEGFEYFIIYFWMYQPNMDSGLPIVKFSKPCSCMT